MKHGPPYCRGRGSGSGPGESNHTGLRDGSTRTRQEPEEFAFRSLCQGEGNDAHPMFSHDRSSQTRRPRVHRGAYLVLHAYRTLLVCLAHFTAAEYVLFGPTF